MSLRKRQIRYIKEGDSRNSTGANRINLISGALFSGATRIVDLQISAIPGFGVYINETPFPIRVLSNGDINTVDKFMYKFPESILQMQPVYNIRCEAESLDRLQRYNQDSAFSGDPHYLLIDYVEEVND